MLVHGRGCHVLGLVVVVTILDILEVPGLEDDVAWSGLDAGTRGVEGMMDENLVGS